MKTSEKKKKRLEIGRQISGRIRNQDGASLMAALLFFVFCGVGASIVLAATSASAGKIRHLPQEDQKRYAVDSAAAFLRDELQKPANAVTIKEVIVEDSRENVEDTDEFSCYYANKPEEAFYSSQSGHYRSDAGVLDSMIVEIYRDYYYQNQMGEESDSDHTEGTPDGGTTLEDTSQPGTEQRDFSLSVKQSGTGEKKVDALKTKVCLYMADNYKITALISDTLTAEDKPEELCEKRLTLEPVSSQNRTVKVEVHDESEDDSEEEGENSGAGEEDEDDSYTVTTTTLVTTVSWQNGVIEKELLDQNETNE